MTYARKIAKYGDFSVSAPMVLNDEPMAPNERKQSLLNAASKLARRAPKQQKGNTTGGTGLSTTGGRRDSKAEEDRNCPNAEGGQRGLNRHMGEWETKM